MSYYRRSIRRGGRVTSEYLGSGETGRMLRDLYASQRSQARLMRLEAELERRNRIDAAKEAADAGREYGEFLATLEGVVRGYGGRVDAAIASALEAIGYHRPRRGPWRRKRGAAVKIKTEVVKTRVGELIALAREGDRLALGRLSDGIADSLNDAVAEGQGDLDEVAEINLIECLRSVDGHDRARHKQAIEARMEQLRRQLAPPGSSPIETLLARRAALNWLHVAILEQELALIHVFAGWDEKKALAQARAFTRAQDAYTKSLVALAKVKRLEAPMIVGQINIAADGGQQINQAITQDASIILP